MAPNHSYWWRSGLVVPPNFPSIPDRWNNCRTRSLYVLKLQQPFRHARKRSAHAKAKFKQHQTRGNCRVFECLTISHIRYGRLMGFSVPNQQDVWAQGLASRCLLEQLVPQVKLTIIIIVAGRRWHTMTPMFGCLQLREWVAQTWLIAVLT